jgi:hypothetical protein
LPRSRHDEYISTQQETVRVLFQDSVLCMSTSAPRTKYKKLRWGSSQRLSRISFNPEKNNLFELESR